MFQTIVGAHKKVCIRIVHGWAEGDNLHVSLTEQGNTLMRYEVVELRTAARLQLVRTDLDKSLHFEGRIHLRVYRP